jgi:ribonuclease PH
MSRPDGREPGELRLVTMTPGFMRSASGSVLIEQGATRVICTASTVDGVPRWMQGQGRGWVTAEYGMLPASTGDRKQRDVTRGRPDGRTVEIQRLIGRALRGIVDFEALGERTIWIDCHHRRLRGACDRNRAADRRRRPDRVSAYAVGGRDLVRHGRG